MGTKPTPTDPDALLSLVQRVKENYQEPPPPPPKRGKKRDFTALSFLLLAAVAVTLRTFGNTELRKLLEKDRRLRQAMGFEEWQQLAAFVEGDASAPPLNLPGKVRAWRDGEQLLLQHRVLP